MWSTFAVARTNLEEKLPKPFVESAIKIAQGMEGFLEKDVPPEVAAVKDADILRDFKSATRHCQRGIPRVCQLAEDQKAAAS